MGDAHEPAAGGPGGEQEPPEAPTEFTLPDRFMLIVEDADGQEVLVRTPEELHVIDQARLAHASGAVIERDDTVTVDGLPGVWYVDDVTEFAWSGSFGHDARPPTVRVSQTVSDERHTTVTGVEVYPTRVHLVRKGNITQDILDVTEKALAASNPDERQRLDGALHALLMTAGAPLSGRTTTSAAARPVNLPPSSTGPASGHRPAPPSSSPTRGPSPRR